MRSFVSWCAVAILVMLLSAVQVRAAELKLSAAAGLTAAPADAAPTLVVGQALGASPADRVQAWATLGYAAVNLAGDDLLADAATLEAAQGRAQIPVVSANVLKASGDGRIAKPFAVIDVGGRKVAVTGVTRPPTSPGDGLRLVDPVESLKDVIGPASEQTDLLVVLAWADRQTAREIAAAYPQVDAVLVSDPLVDPTPIRVGGCWIIQAPAEQGVRGEVQLEVTDAGAVDAATAHLRAAPPLPEEILAIAAKSDRTAIGQAAARADEAQPQPVLASLPENETAWLQAGTGNRSVDLVVRSLALQDRYGPKAAPQGSSFLVLQTEWENKIPLQFIYERQVPTEYKVPNLGDHLYLLLNGTRVLRLKPDLAELPGHLPVKDFSLPRIGARESGNLVLEVPDSPIDSLELRFYDFAHGHMFLPLVRSDRPVAEAKPLTPPQKNEVVEAAVFGLDKSDQLGGEPAPEGMHYVTLDLRARSQFTFEADATAFDPNAKPGDKMQIGTVADWTEAYKYAQLVVDGEYGYSPLPQSTLGEAPRFLPDVMTGGELVFLAPKDAKSLELRCDFPNAKTPSGQVIRPRGLTLAVEGQRPELPKREALVEIEDGDIFRVAVTEQQTAGVFAGRDPGMGNKFLVLDVTVANLGKENGEFFQTKEQLKYTAEDGSQRDIDEVSFDGVYRPGELVWIPPGERRSFQAVFAIPATDAKPRLAYNGINLAQIYDLPPLEAVGQAAVADKPVEPAEQAPAPAVPEAPAAEQPAPPAQPVEVAAKPADPAHKPATPAVATFEVNGKEFPARVPAKQPHAAKGISGVGLTPEMINSAIDRGADALWALTRAEMEKRRQEFGKEDEHVLVALALVHAGAHKRMPDFDAHLRGWLVKADPYEIAGTYEIGLLCMLIEAYEDPAFLPLMRNAAQWLVDTQGPNGTWGYGQSAPKAGQEDQVRRVLKVAGGRPLDGSKPTEQKVQRTTPADKGQDGDNSVTQYAILGLHSASRSGIKVPPEVWQKALATTRKRQSERDGGWAYVSPGVGYGSMTAAGICAVALARHELGEATPAEDVDIEQGLGWFNAHFRVDNHPGHENDWVYYYLYSVERVGRILDTEFLGEHEWYALGAQFLVKAQNSDGLWTWKRGHETDPRLASSFALLFLTRATPSLNPEEKVGPGKLKTAVLLPPSKKLYIILDCSGSMLEEMAGRQKFDIAKDAVRSLVTELPDNTDVALRLYGYRKRAIEPGANEDSNLIIPMDTLDRSKFAEILDGSRARGKTPLAYSLEQATKDLASYADESNPVTVLLLTDGGEDTQPRKDPVKAAEGIGKLQGVDLKIVGFDINREDWSKQLQQMAVAGRGQYLPATQSEELNREVKKAVFGVPDGYTILDEDRNQIGAGKFGQELQLEPGKYFLRTVFAGKAFQEEFWINAATTTSVTFDAEAVAAELGQAPPTDPADAVPPASAAPAPSTAAPAPSTAAPAPQAQPPASDSPPAAEKKFCTQCGAKLAPGAKFCTSCGSRLQ